MIQDNTEREAETALVTLMNYEKFDLIKVLLRNQLTIVWCTRLANAQDDDEKMRIEVSTFDGQPRRLIVLLLEICNSRFRLWADVYFQGSCTSNVPGYSCQQELQDAPI